MLHLYLICKTFFRVVFSSFTIKGIYYCGQKYYGKHDYDIESTKEYYSIEGIIQNAAHFLFYKSVY